MSQAVMDEEPITSTFEAKPNPDDDIPMEWRKVRLRRLPKDGSKYELGVWIVSRDGKGRRRRYLNADLPDRYPITENVIHRAGNAVHAYRAICQRCNHAYTEMIQRAHSFPEKPATLCPECRGDEIMETALAIQEATGINLGVAPLSDELLTEREQRAKRHRSIAAEDREGAAVYRSRWNR